MTEGRLPVESSSIDIVWICLVLGGVVDDHVLLETILEVRRVLKEDGLLFLIENTEQKDSTSYWKFRQFDHYRSLFDFVTLHHLGDYYDLGERISIMAGRRNDIMNR
jgi:ubiquinone/menaquinone biosynthesis C-methylase UbiE